VTEHALTGIRILDPPEAVAALRARGAV